MENLWIVRFCQMAAAGIGSMIVAIYGGVDGVLITLAAFVIGDYISGIIAAAKNHEISSKVGFKGLAKKVLIFVICGVAAILDHYIMGNSGAIRSMVMIFYISNEGISILENCGRCGVKFPEKLTRIFEALKEEKK